MVPAAVSHICRLTTYIHPSYWHVILVVALVLTMLTARAQEPSSTTKITPPGDQKSPSNNVDAPPPTSRGDTSTSAAGSDVQHLGIEKAIHDWRFPCCILFLASILGRVLYKMTPPPAEAAPHLAMLQKAARASLLANRANLSRLETMADVVGVQAIVTINRCLRKQRRFLLLVAAACVAVALVPIFATAPIAMLPDWVYAVFALCGAYWTYRFW